MTDQNFNFEIETALLHFKSAFDNAVINRYSGEADNTFSNRSVISKIKVNYVFGPRQRILADLEGKTDTVKFPIVAICPTGMGRDDSRVKNKNDNIRFKHTDGSYGNLQVVPWNINVTMSIMAKYQEDITQIISNFATVTNPYIVFSWKEPKTGREVNAEVYWDGQMSMEYPGAGSDLAPNAPFRVMGTANFVIKTYLYRTDISNTAKICKIDTDIIVTDKFYCNYESLAAETADNDRDQYEILGKPQLRYVDQYYLTTGKEHNIHIQGDGFALTDAVYLSGSNLDIYPLKSYDYNGITFNGYLVDSFEVLDSQNITFNLPPASSYGFVDVIITNTCGVGKLTEGANRCSRVLNPYKPTDPNYFSWRVQQFPYLNGLIVSSNLNDPINLEFEDVILVYNDNISSSLSCQPYITVRPIDYTSLTLDDVSDYLQTTVLATNSSLWNSVYSTVDTNSADWLQTLSFNETNAELSISNGNVISLSSLSGDGTGGSESDPIFTTWANSNSANYDSTFVTVNTNSADWSDHTDISLIESTSANWNDVYTNVYAHSADWNYQGTDIKSLTANWENIYITVETNSALWAIDTDTSYDDSLIQSTSANWNSTYNTVNTNSANWNYQGTDIKSLTSDYASTFVTVNSNSANWNSHTDLTLVQNASGGWNNTQNVVETNSALWVIDADTIYDDTLLQSASGGWNDIQNVVETNSASWAIDTDTVYDDSLIRSVSANWNSVYNTVNTNSANWLQTLSFNETNVELSISNGDIVSLSSLSGGGSNGLESDPIFVTWANSNSANYESTYITVNTNSASWFGGGSGDADVNVFVYSNSATILDVNNIVYTNSADWNNHTDLSLVEVASANWDSSYTIVSVNSSFWSSHTDLTLIQNASGGWNNTQNVVETNSALWVIDADTIYDDSLIQSTSANWDSTYTTVNLHSADWADHTNISLVESASANWNSSYTTVNTNSANWLQTLSFNETNAELSISNGNIISLSSLSGGGGSSGPESDPIFNTWANSNSANYESTFVTVNTNSATWGSGSAPTIGVVTIADQTSTSTTLATISPMTIALEANSTYMFEVNLTVQSSAAAEACGTTITGPTGSTGAYLTRVATNNLGGWLYFFQSSLGNLTMHSAGVAVPAPINIHGRITTSSTAGDITVQYRAETGGANSVTIKDGSGFRVTRQ